MENITTKEVMDKLEMVGERQVKVDEFCWWYMKRIQTDTCTQFTHKESQEGISVCGVRLALAARKHQEINGQVKVTHQTLQTNSQ